MGLEVYDHSLSFVDLTDPVLRGRARRLRTDEMADSALDGIVARMWQVLDSVEGGVRHLAAPQVGIPLAIFLVEYGEVRAAYANPVRSGLPWPSSELGREGCLSLPGYRARVMRPRTVMPEAVRVDGHDPRRHGLARPRLLPRDRPSRRPALHRPRPARHARTRRPRPGRLDRGGAAPEISFRAHVGARQSAWECAVVHVGLCSITTRPTPCATRSRQWGRGASAGHARRRGPLLPSYRPA